ncbi:type 1 glutamine amidotransferase [Streptomyces sp. TS71-3]|uniref:type 1 glutamine amidotransferase n=1 Tax=Streptomyces sp. TS71-3 TaxID=2733862 RepID=UPI001B13FD52|nr:type 1 glutamine amidotransferase [Streptomyces sp. TS71-3]GHJ34647.1 aminotransferase [Streptomyces sp. TS71-3]
MATALVVQNTRNGGPGRWAPWLAEAGLAQEVVQPHAGARLPERLAHDALIVLGGGFMPDDEERAPWLRAVRRLVDEALERAVPYFGICLGGQLLAQHAGGEVKPSHGTPEFGSVRLTLRRESSDDPLFGGLPPEVTAIQNHVDQITRLPAGATWLASSADCPHQAFRLGPAAWGVQFHPEAGADRIPNWGEARLTAHGADRAALHRHALAAEPESARTWHTVAQRFADLTAD